MTNRVRLKVLVVDDDKTVADTVSHVLRCEGFQVDTFYNPLLALQHAMRSELYALVTDYTMPQLNGLELASRLQETYPDCKIVILSGDAALMAEKADPGLKFTLLQKPAEVCVLLAALE